MLKWSSVINPWPLHIGAERPCRSKTRTNPDSTRLKRQNQVIGENFSKVEKIKEEEEETPAAAETSPEEEGRTNKDEIKEFSGGEEVRIEIETDDIEDQSASNKPEEESIPPSLKLGILHTIIAKCFPFDHATRITLILMAFLAFVDTLSTYGLV